MAVLGAAVPRRSTDQFDAVAMTHGPERSLLLPVLVIGAWVVIGAAQATGTAALLHHHALIEAGPPLWLAIPAFLVAWQVMVMAMMLPASLPTIRVVGAIAGRHAHARYARVGFLAGFAPIWAAFGLLAFLGDLVLHHVVDATPWLATRSFLIEAGILAIAGAWQFTPAKRRNLLACRDPHELAAAAAPEVRGQARLGFRHGLTCLGSSWALMLLMFGEGFANLWWMVALTALMVYETTGRRGQRAASAAGAVLLIAAWTAVVLPGSIA